ncbi:hypothetical protein J31TS4_06210 [Paenibacillus sp. J31TS4]|uniref:putative amidoligase domain-containing protein n=1 Tax=Paenibacillus sp. J31TS4 TaxID=2807195 RepID=UPI001B0809E0|nr:hypothetical protein [Paenibacillus sp. J31TS4]GIP37341.1 hypothetical protein J31TS4_06210 [Paenibacillus sp. J31TS4]
MAGFVLHAREPEAARLLERLTVPAGTLAPQGTEWVLRWGTEAADPPGVWTLNPRDAVRRCLDISARERLLRLGGIKTEASHGKMPGARRGVYPWEYWIPVFHLETLAIYERKNTQPLIQRGTGEQAGAYRRLAPGERGFHARRAAREAVKAAYALGLDFALVGVAATVDGHTIVREIRPCPKLNAELAVLYADAIDRFAEEREREREEAADRSLLLGADPEFLLLRPDGKVANAAKFLEKQGGVGCDAVVQSGHRLIHPLVELRPEPAADPHRLAARIGRSMREADRLIPDRSLLWLAGSMPVPGVPLGGHVHLSGIPLTSRLLRVLDNYAALPLVMLESASGPKRRPRYGILGDFRRKGHGGFEYRSLPSWLESPGLAAGVLCLVYCLARHERELSWRPLAEEEMQRAFYTIDKEALRPAVARIWEEIRRTETYAACRKDLQALESRTLAGDDWEESRDVKPAWGLTAVPAAGVMHNRESPSEKTGASPPFVL